MLGRITLWSAPFPGGERMKSKKSLASTSGLREIASSMRIERILQKVQAHVRGEPVEPDLPQLVRADLVVDRLVAVLDRAIAAQSPCHQPTANQSGYLTYKEARAEFDIPKSTLYALAKAKRIAVRRLPGSAMLFSRDSLAKLCEEHTFKPSPNRLRPQPPSRPKRSRISSTQQSFRHLT